ncbi:hypothetical protein KCV01_g20364, partial [Aureobasidium melanogenum]
LKEDHRPTAEYVRELREKLPRLFPTATFSFPPADIISQILNFGSPAPIDLQIRGPNVAANFKYADTLLREIRRVPGVVDARIQQSQASPTFNVDVDRSRAQQVGITERDVTNSLGVNLAGSSQIAPTFWLNPQNGVSYPIVMQTPQYAIDTLPDLANVPISPSAGSAGSQILGGLASFSRTTSSTVVSQYNINSMVEIFATTQDRDLGGVATDIQKILDAHKKDLPKASSTALLGQVQTMNSAFTGLILGLLGAIVLIYLLIVVNFQSWADPFVIVTALPAAIAGIIWMLFATHTTLSVPALTGAIMCMGVATANSILVVSFCRERLADTGDAFIAASEGGFVRFRPVLMTALAMIIGMLPMALGMGEGGEQNAPLGRAVIGGLIFATTATLLFVPVVFNISPSMSPDTIHTPPPRRLRLAGVIAAIVVLAIVVAGVATRANESRNLREWTDEQATPSVTLVTPQGGQGGGDLNLPGRLQAYARAPIYARTSGYLKSWKYDIGQKVKAGDILGEIETPDLDQQLLQAKADLASARANEALAQITAKRWQAMRDSDSVSKQEVDEKSGDYDAKHALATAAQANLERIQATKGFAKLVAPFDGVVTARETDVGALINAGGGGQELFVVSDTHKLRMYVNVPQNYAPSIKQGATVKLTVPEYPGQTFEGKVESTSSAINAASGTTLVQVAVDNNDGRLLPGGY